MTEQEREEIRQRYLAVDTSIVADVLDELGLPDQGLHSSFTPIPASLNRVAGWAHTIQGQMTPTPIEGGDREKMEACGSVTPGSVTVWSGGGEGVCFFGELIALGMMERGCAGAIVDGGIRDVKWLEKHGFPVFARYRTPIQSIGRWKVNANQIPVSMPGATRRHVTVNPGDFVFGDEDGAIVIPADLVKEVLEKSEAMAAKEVEIRRQLAAGLSLSEALDSFGHV